MCCRRTHCKWRESREGFCRWISSANEQVLVRLRIGPMWHFFSFSFLWHFFFFFLSVLPTSKYGCELVPFLTWWKTTTKPSKRSSVRCDTMNTMFVTLPLQTLQRTHSVNSIIENIQRARSVFGKALKKKCSSVRAVRHNEYNVCDPYPYPRENKFCSLEGTNSVL